MNRSIYFKNNKYIFNLVKNKNIYPIQNFSSVSPKIIKSKIQDIHIPSISLEEYIWKGLDKWHNKIATICSETGRSYLYSDIYKNSKALKNVLCSFPNLKQHDTLAIILPNIPEYPIVMLGAIEAGLKVTTLNPIYTADEICKQLQDSDAKIIFTLSDLWPTINKAVENFNSRIPIVVLKHQKDDVTPTGAIQYDQLIENGKNMNNNNYNIEKKYEDVIILPYSSGTTGVPKGVELTNKSIVSNLHQMNAPELKMFNDAEGNHQEVVPLLSPIFHLYGMVVIMFNMLSSGCKLVTIPKFGASSFVKILNDFRPTFAYVTPPTVLFLLNNENVRPEYISRIKTIVSAAAPLGALDVDKLKEKSKNQTNVLQLYGLTETSPITHLQTTRIRNGVKPGGCGFTLPNTECKILSVDNETILGPNETGELLVRGPQVMKGYRNNIKSTRDMIDAEGWLRTGDIGYYDENEHFYITDRLKELIKVKGYQVAPAELEELLRSHPSIQDAAVVGVPHDRFGEVPRAFVVTKENSKIDLHNIKNFIDSQVANYKQLTGGIVKVDSIPKNASGKILRRVLKEL